MTRYSLSPLARADLDDIWEYTSKRWDDDQAETYLLAIRAAFDLLAANPKLGRPIDEVHAGYRRHRVGSRMIFNRETPEAVDIVRVLHDKMDIGTHLPALQ